MSRVMVDTSVWMDVVLGRPMLADESRGAIMACLERGDDVLIAASSLKDVFFFAAQSAGTDAAYRAVELVLTIASPAQVDGTICKEALALGRPDYEYGIVAACALAEGASTIITRNEHSFSDIGLAKRSPGELLSELGYEPIDWPGQGTRDV